MRPKTQTIAERKAYLRTYMKDYRARNREKASAYMREWNLTNKSRVRASQLKREYNLTLEEHASMLAAQGGVCGICELPPKPGKVLVVDHDHATGKVRALLCIGCNTRVGHFESRLRVKTIAYLERHGSL